jgi:hypothetical protein
MDLEPGYEKFYQYLDLGHLFGHSDSEFRSLNTPSLETAALGLLTLEECHDICYWQFSQRRATSIYNTITVNLGAVVSCSSVLEDYVEIARLPRIESNLHMLLGCNRAHWVEGDVMTDGWTRYYSFSHRG